MTRSRLLFAGAVFLGSFLLFLVEPIAAKQLLPVLGGSAAVWITCLVFFQTALAGAYLYAHWLARRPRWILHFASALLVGIARGRVGCAQLRSRRSEPSAPIATVVFCRLSAWIGFPFSCSGRRVRCCRCGGRASRSGGIPYRLFALSNLASLLALGLYPSLIEPRLTLQAQRIAWACGFAVFAVLSAVLAWKTRDAQ